MSLRDYFWYPIPSGQSETWHGFYECEDEVDESRPGWDAHRSICNVNRVKRDEAVRDRRAATPPNGVTVCGRCVRAAVGLGHDGAEL